MGNASPRWAYRASLTVAALGSTGAQRRSAIRQWFSSTVDTYPDPVYYCSTATQLTYREGRDDDDQDQGQRDRLGQAIENLRKQHLWGDISDENYRREREALERQMKVVAKTAQTPELPNLERAARLLEYLPSLWQHPGVTHEQREA